MEMRGACFLAVAMSLISGSAMAAYPDRPITFIVPFSAGGNADLGVRTAEPYLEACLGGADIVVVNKPGAGGAVGFSEIAAAPADGYTLGVLNTPNYYSYPIVKESPWKVDSFELLGSLVGSVSTINVRPDSPLKSLEDLIRFAKSSDKPVNVGVPGIGGGDHLAMLRFADATGVKFTYIPFTDGPSVRNALLGGHVDIAIMSEVNAASFKGEIMPLATARAERGDLLPDTPTFREGGVDLVSSSQHIFAAPAGIPEEVRSKLVGCLDQTVKDPAFLADAKKRSLLLLPMTIEHLKEYVAGEDAFYRKLWQTNPWQ
jgi:tripartite-type tricarboxylate transporter receptor subunit TctC